jgi:hypothetical protein
MLYTLELSLVTIDSLIAVLLISLLSSSYTNKLITTPI